MSRRILRCWVAGWLMLVGCGSDDASSLAESPGTSVDGGADAAGGAGGTEGGTGGSAGAGGSAGVAAKGGAAGDAGAAGESGHAGQGGAAGAAGGELQDAGPDAPLCPDPLHEPNESEAEAASLGDVAVCKSKTLAGIAAFDSDVDWYRFDGKDQLLSTCTPTPTASVDIDHLRVCVFAQCKSGSTSLVCAQGLSATSPAGRQGCCATGGPVELTPACSGTNKDATVYVRVDQQGANSCAAYQLQYGY